MPKPSSPYPHSDKDLISRITRSANARAGYKQLVRELGLGGGRERRLLLEQLARITLRGDLQKLDTGHWTLPSKSLPDPNTTNLDPMAWLRQPKSKTRENLITGKLDLHRDGFGFVRPNGATTREDDLFIPPSELNGAMQGDEVLVDEAPPGRPGVDRKPRRSGRIARVLTRRNPTVVGIFHYAKPHGRASFLSPADTSSPADTASPGETSSSRTSPLSSRSAAEGSAFAFSAPRNNYITPLDERMTQPILIPNGPNGEVLLPSTSTAHRVLGTEAHITQPDPRVPHPHDSPIVVRVGIEQSSPALAPQPDPRVPHPHDGSIVVRVGTEQSSTALPPQPNPRVPHPHDGPVVVRVGTEQIPTALPPQPANPPESELSLEGLAVDVEITELPTLTRPARGRILEVLGHPDDFGVDVEIVIRKHHLPYVFPANVLAEAADSATQTVATLPAEDLAHRRDFRHLPILTIDGETARDFDDAVLVQPLPNGNWQLQVHIADVSHYVAPATALDLEARLRGTSVYFPDRAVPMLPPALSSGMCSLRPGEDRLVLSCIAEIDPHGEVAAFEVCEGIIRSSARLTYNAVQAILDGKPPTEIPTKEVVFAKNIVPPKNIVILSEAKDPRVPSPTPALPPAQTLEALFDHAQNNVILSEAKDLHVPQLIDEALGQEEHIVILSEAKDPRVPSPTPEFPAPPTLEANLATITPHLHQMHTLALLLNAKRHRRGSIDFDLPEPVIQFDPQGNMAAITRSERGWANRLIEEFMLTANECVAHWLEALTPQSPQPNPRVTHPNDGSIVVRVGIEQSSTALLPQPPDPPVASPNSFSLPASLYRIHELPDPKRILDFEETAATYGHSLGFASLPVKQFTMKSDRRTQRADLQRRGSARPPQTHDVPESIPVTPQMYQRLTAKIAGTAEERILSFLMLRSLKQARYAAENEGHFALASPSYTHFTSPIRRYPDLIIHRLLRQALRAGADPQGPAILSTDPQPWSTKSRAPIPAPETWGSSTPDPLPLLELQSIALESSQSERRADDAERELMEWKKIKFMQDRVGEDFQATVLSCTKYGFFVELDDLFIEGLVPLSSLSSSQAFGNPDRFFFRDTDRSIVGSSTGRVFRLGTRVHVLLDRIDRPARRLQFTLVPEPLTPTPKSSAPKSPVPHLPTTPRKPKPPKAKPKARLRDKKSKPKRR